MMRRRTEEVPTVRISEPGYWDYFTYDPAIPGTDLIMRVYEALRKRRYKFYFSYFFGDALFTGGIKEHLRVHFYIPDLETVIMVKGGYWFDKGDNLNDTALEIAMLEYAGKKVIFWTEDQVMYWGIDELIKREPLLNQPYEHGDPIDTDYPPFDYRKYVMTPGRPFRKERMVRRGGRRRPKR